MRSKNKNILMLIGGIIILIIVLNLTLKSQPVSILPSGSFNSNTDCSFITNTDYNFNEEILDYATKGWVSVDWDNDGILEGYGYSGSATSTQDIICSEKEVIATTPGGFKVVKFRESSSYQEIAVCGSYKLSSSQETFYSARKFRNPDNDARNAIFTCGTIPPTPTPSPSPSPSSDCHSGSLGDWSYCESDCRCNSGEGDCDSDSQCAFGTTCVRNVGSNYGFPSTMDVCESTSQPSPTPSPTPCLSFDELMNVANKWASC